MVHVLETKKYKRRNCVDIFYRISQNLLRLENFNKLEHKVAGHRKALTTYLLKYIRCVIDRGPLSQWQALSRFDR